MSHDTNAPCRSKAGTRPQLMGVSAAEDSELSLPGFALGLRELPAQSHSPFPQGSWYIMSSQLWSRKARFPLPQFNTALQDWLWDLCSITVQLLPLPSCAVLDPSKVRSQEHFPNKPPAQKILFQSSLSGESILRQSQLPIPWNYLIYLKKCILHFAVQIHIPTG